MKKLLNNSRRDIPILKFDLKMKLSVLFIFLALFTIHANSSYGQGSKVSLNLNNISVLQLIEKIENTTEFRFIYKVNDVDLKRRITVNVKNQNIDEILNIVFKETTTNIRFNNRLIYLTKSKSSIRVQPKRPQFSINGKVLDKDGNPLPGASIVIKGTTKGTTTDFDGNFSILVLEENTTLIFTYIGFITKEIVVRKESNLEITLLQNATDLDEIVVVGYGTQTKKSLVGAVGVIEGEELNGRPITQTSQALYGLSSGVYVNSVSGEAGNDQVNIQIRGIGTLNDSNPLILVDGIEAPMNNVNPADIKSISVLKDAASTSIYGSRASNGVILITTKRGNYKKKLEINYDTSTGFSSATVLPDYVMDNRLYLELYREARENSGLTVTYTDADIDRYDDVQTVDWMNEVFRDAKINKHSFSMNGGSENISFNFSLGYLNQESIMDTQGFTRYNTRLNLNTKISEKVNLGTSFSFALGDALLPTKASDYNSNDSFGNVDFLLAIAQTPFSQVYDEQGRYATEERALGINTLGNARAILDNTSNNKLDYDFLGSMFVEYEPIKDLKIKGTVAVNSQITDYNIVKKYADLYDVVTGESFTASESYPGSDVIEQRLREFNLTTWLQLNYTKSFGKHKFSGLAGINQETYTSDQLTAEQTNFSFQELLLLNADNGTLTGLSSTHGEWALRSFFGKFNYDFDDKYLFDVTVRRDGSSRFGENNRWGTFPAIGIGWLVSKENFWNPSLFNFLKIRGSWGVLGNQNTNNYPFASAFDIGNSYILDGVLSSGGALTSLGNEDLKWESTESTDFGVELGLFNSRLSLEADYFIRTTRDILTELDNPLVTGITAATIVNAASVENKGWEASLKYKNAIGKFNYAIGGNITNVKNKIIAINPDLIGADDFVSLDLRNNTNLIRGEQINAIYGYVTDDIYRSQEEIDNSGIDSSIFGTPEPGDFKVSDLNGDGQITTEDQRVIGNRMPEWVYGFNFDFKYKNFDLSTIFQAIGSADVFISRHTGPFPKVGLLTEWVDHWSPENPDSDNPRLWYDRSGYNGNTVQNLPSSFWVKDRKYLRLKNIQVGYNIPSQALDEIFINSLRIYLNGQNIWTKTDLTNWDPERTTDQTYVNTSLPQAKTYTLGLNIKF